MKSLPLFALLLFPAFSWAQVNDTRRVAVAGVTDVPQPSSDLMKVVGAIRRVQSPPVTTVSPGADGRSSSATSVPGPRLPAFIDGKPATDEQLNALTLAEVREVALQLDPSYATHPGHQGAIVVTTYQKNKAKEKK